MTAGRHLDTITRHAQAAREHTTARDRAIVAAHRAGHSISAIARAAGMTRQGIQPIVRRDTMSTLTATATADVIDGEITVDAPESEDTDILHHDGRVLGLRGELEPWGAEEFGMERADAQLAVMGWRRVSDWTGSEMLTATVVVRDA